jgi:RNA polymerase sigma-70 factor (ECF subfamily)
VDLALPAQGAVESVPLITGEAAFETVVQHFEEPVFNLVSRLLDDPSDAADVVHVVFLKVLRNRGTFRGESAPKTWIYRIAVNEACNRGRRRSRPEAMFDSEARTPIEEALNRVNPKFRIPLVLREIEGLSYEEISEILKIPPGTVKSRLLRGWDALRKHLAGRPDPLSALEACGVRGDRAPMIASGVEVRAG